MCFFSGNELGGETKMVDGVKSVNVDDKLKVKDLAELCVDAL